MEHHVHYQHFILSVIDTDSVEVESTPDTVNICDNSNNQAQVTCRISKENVNPEPTFSFSPNGLKFDPETVSNDGSYYQSQFSLSPDVGGEYQVTCRVTNTVLNTWQDKGTNIIYRSELEVGEINLFNIKDGYFWIGNFFKIYTA